MEQRDRHGDAEREDRLRVATHERDDAEVDEADEAGVEDMDRADRSRTKTERMGSGAEGPVGRRPEDGEDADLSDAPTPEGSPAVEPVTAGAGTAGDRQASAAGAARPAETGPAETFELLPGSDVEGYRRRFDQLQASFVDDPRGSAEGADALVGELLQRMARRHDELRDELGGRSGDTDTEAMRLALRQYRAIFTTLVGR